MIQFSNAVNYFLSFCEIHRDKQLILKLYDNAWNIKMQNYFLCIFSYVLQNNYRGFSPNYKYDQTIPEIYCTHVFSFYSVFVFLIIIGGVFNYYSFSFLSILVKIFWLWYIIQWNFIYLIVTLPLQIHSVLTDTWF